MSRFGKVLFISGSVLLVLCGITLPFWKDFNSALLTVVFAVLVSSAIMILLGEMFRYSGKKQDEKLGLGFMDSYRQARGKTRAGHAPRARGRSRAESRRCAFCGLDLTPTTIPARLDGVVDMSLSESHAATCQECGKLVCPQCAFRKGMEMGLRSFRCPACGGRVA